MSTNSNTISVLNSLIETLKDGQDGFRAASADVQSQDTKSIFQTYSQQRGRFMGELQALAQTLGEPEPETTGSAEAKIHRGWMDLKSVLTSKDEHAILVECERGEDSAVAEFRDALDHKDLPANVRAVIARQAADVQKAHDRVRNLRDCLAPA